MGIVQIKMLQSLPRLGHFFLMGLMGGLWVLKYKESEQIALRIVASLWLIYRVFIKFILTIFASILIFLMIILYILLCHPRSASVYTYFYGLLILFSWVVTVRARWLCWGIQIHLIVLIIAVCFLQCI